MPIHYTCKPLEPFGVSLHDGCKLTERTEPRCRQGEKCHNCHKSLEGTGKKKKKEYANTLRRCLQTDIHENAGTTGRSKPLRLLAEVVGGLVEPLIIRVAYTVTSKVCPNLISLISHAKAPLKDSNLGSAGRKGRTGHPFLTETFRNRRDAFKKGASLTVAVTRGFGK